MRTVITGGAGFLGSHLADVFLTEGHDVVAVDNLLTGRRENVAHLASNPRFKLIEHDITTPLNLNGPVDHVLHFASPASPIDYEKYKIETMKVGSLGTMNALDVAKSKGARFLLASTSEVYGDPEKHPQTEDYWGRVNPVGPRSVYDEAKRYAEAVTMAYHREYKSKTRIVRIFNTYGPRMRPNDGRAVCTFIAQALNGEDLTVAGDGSQTRSFCYVSDLVDGIRRLLASDEPLPVNIGNPIEITVLELAKEILQLTGSKSRIVFIPRPEDDPGRRRPDISKAKKLLGWEPRVDRREGLRKTIEYFQKLEAQS